MTLEERFWAKVEKTDGCWNWTGNRTRQGYGRMQVGRTQHAPGVQRAAHRLSLFFHQGLPLDGWKYGDPEVDHICRNRLCVNPAHLRLVDHRTNILENSVALPARHAVKTHCPAGHPYDEANTMRPAGKGQGRHCRACMRVSSREWHRADRARAKAAVQGFP